MQYCTTVCSVLYVNTTASVFKFFVCLSEYSRKQDTSSGSPDQRTLFNLFQALAQSVATGVLVGLDPKQCSRLPLQFKYETP